MRATAEQEGQEVIRPRGVFSSRCDSVEQTGSRVLAVGPGLRCFILVEAPLVRVRLRVRFAASPCECE